MSSQASPDATEDDDELSEEVDRDQKKWKLKDCSMRIGSYGKRSVKDQAMTLDLVFDFDGDPTSKVVGTCS